VFRQRNENTVIANTAAINSTDVKTMRYSNTKLETLFPSFDANVYTTIHTINCLRVKRAEN